MTQPIINKSNQDRYMLEVERRFKTVCAHEEALIVRAYFGMRNLLFNLED